MSLLLFCIPTIKKKEKYFLKEKEKPSGWYCRKNLSLRTLYSIKDIVWIMKRNMSGTFRGVWSAVTEYVTDGRTRSSAVKNARPAIITI